MILSPNRSSRNGAKVRLIAVHSAEGARDRISLGKYFQGPVDASSHVGIDAGGVEQYVPYNEKAWTLLNGNPISENAELCAFARWSRAQWLSEGTVDGVVNPKRMLDNAAAWIRERCLANGIPIRKIDAAAIKRGEAGVIGHVDWTNTGDGNHTDPGPNFPWDYVMARAAANQEGEEEMSADDLLNATVEIKGDAPNKGKQMPVREILSWSDANFYGLQKAVDALTKKVDALTTGGVDVQALANALGGPLGDHLRDSLDAVSYNALVRALNTTKGSVSLHVTGSEGV